MGSVSRFRGCLQPLLAACLSAAVTLACGAGKEVQVSKSASLPNIVPWKETRSDLSSVFFVASDRGWAVGGGGTILASGDGGMTWVRQTSGVAMNLEAVYFESSDLGWAVGAGGSILATKNGGSTWTRQLSGTDEGLKGVYFVDEDSGWIVGAAGTILRTDDGGETWAQVRPLTSSDLTDVYFLDDSLGWIVGDKLILRTRNRGATWEPVSASIDTGLEAVHFTNATEGWVVGKKGAIFSTRDGGVTWERYAFDIVTEADLADVFFLSEEIGWIVGSSGTALATDDIGRSWVRKRTNTSRDLSSVFFIEEDAGWFVGQSGTILQTGGFGTNCTSGKLQRGWDLVSAAFPTAAFGWAVGPEGTIVATTDGGASWTSQSLDRVTSYLQSVYFTNPSVGWAVGSGGTILYTDSGGRQWTYQESFTDEALWSVYFIDDQRGWVAGQAGTILHTVDSGVTWSPQFSPSFKDLASVYFVTGNAGWVVGSRGSILFTNNGGNTWSEQESGTGADLLAAYFVDADTGWAVGDRGTIIKTDDGGQNWSPQTSGVMQGLEAVYFRNSRQGWIVGGRDLLGTSDGGRSWIPQQTCAGQSFPPMKSVHFASASKGLALGGRGDVVRCSRDDAPFVKVFGVDETQSRISWAVEDDCALSALRCNLSFQYQKDHDWIAIRESIAPSSYGENTAEFSVDWLPSLSRVQHGDQLRYRIEVSDRTDNRVVQDVPGEFPYGTLFGLTEEWWTGLGGVLQLLIIILSGFGLIQIVLQALLRFRPAALLSLTEIQLPEIKADDGLARALWGFAYRALDVMFKSYYSCHRNTRRAWTRIYLSGGASFEGLAPDVFRKYIRDVEFLDAWVEYHREAVLAAFFHQNAACGLAFPAPVSAVLDGVDYRELSPKLLQELFRNRFCLLIVGQGRASNLALACKVASWAGHRDEGPHLSAHCMLPVLIEKDFEFEESEESSADPLVAAVHGKIEASTGAALPLEVVRFLLRTRRILVIIDSLSGMQDAARGMIRPERAGFCVHALIITSEFEETIGGVPRSIIRPIHAAVEGEV